jgi:carbon starvation protein
VNPVLVAITILVIYAVAYLFHGKYILERRVVKADPNAVTPAWSKFDGIDYVPANKYILYGHHFASIAGAGPIVGPAIALAWGWGLPLLWVLFGNIFIGAVHDYLALMASTRYGGLSIMSISENFMGRAARYIFLTYVWVALILVLAAFLSVGSSLLAATPEAATLTWLYMPIALIYGMLIYRLGMRIRDALIVAIVLLVIAFWLSFQVPFKATYGQWVAILALYGFLAAALPVWYLLQPRDFLNALMLWTFVGLAVLAGLTLIWVPITGPVYRSFVAPGAVLGAVAGTEPAKAMIAYFWPTVPLVIACGALSGFHSVVASGTSSKQLSNELEGLMVGYGAMLTEGAVSSLAVILPAAIVWDFAALQAATGAPVLAALEAVGIKAKDILGVSPAAARFTTAYGMVQALLWSNLGIDFVTVFKVFRVFAAVALIAFIVTTLDTANRLARFAWTELFDWVKPRSPELHSLITNRWVASLVAILLGFMMAYPKIQVEVAGKTTEVYAYAIVWPAFAGTNQLLAALALLTSALWVYVALRVRGLTGLVILVPALFLWITVMLALAIWLFLITPGIPFLYQITAGALTLVSFLLSLLLIVLFTRGLLKGRQA